METVACGQCGRVSELDAAMDGGRAPCWWAPDPATSKLRSENKPACPACARAHLTDDGEVDALVPLERVPVPDVVAGPGAAAAGGEDLDARDLKELLADTLEQLRHIADAARVRGHATLAFDLDTLIGVHTPAADGSLPESSPTKTLPRRVEG